MSRAVQDIYPLSPTQRGLLFHSLYGPQSGAYVVQVGYTLRGDLDRDAFAQAWQQLVQRHTVLRTAFVWDNLADPVQVVGHQAQLPIQWLDWRYKSADPQLLEKWLTADRQQGFNLSAAPLMRLTVMEIADSCYRVIWTHHHLLLDGWSLPILLREWMVYYRAATEQSSDLTASNLTVPNLTTPNLTTALPYRDYIAWLQQQDTAAAKSFWRQQLAGITTTTPLGIDRGRANSGYGAQSEQYGTQYSALSLELTQRLQRFAQQHRLTLSTLVQGAWARLLSCYSGENNVVYGLARAGRPSALNGNETRVGLFISTLPMPVKAPPDQTVVAYLQQIQAQQLAQQPYEYASLVEVQAASEIPQGSPLFNSVVVFENYPMTSGQTLPGLEVMDVTITEQTHYPLTLFATVLETLEFKLLYNQQQFSDAVIQRLVGHLQMVLRALVEQPDRPLRELPLLTQAEQQQLWEFGSAVTDRQPEQTVHRAIAHQAAVHPNATAVIFEGETLSYGELDRQASQLAQVLVDRGMTPGTLVGLCVRRSLDMVVALLAILKAGCAYVPLDPTYPTARLGYIVENAGLDWILCHRETQDIAFGPEVQRVSLDALDNNSNNSSDNNNSDNNSDAMAIRVNASASASASANVNAEDAGQLDDLAYLIYTSGSTGKPKGVPIQHRSLSNLLGAMARRLHIKASDTLMAVTTLSFDIAALELFLPLVSGARLLLASDEMVRDGHQMIAHIDAYGVDIMQATPATWRLLLSCGWSGQSGLRLLCGGEALDTSLAQRLLRCAEEVWNVYGPTETTIWSGALMLSAELIRPELMDSELAGSELADAKPANNNSADSAIGSVPIGHPLDNTRFYVLDEEKKPVPIGVAGELYIGGVGLTQGYWQRPELTAERFVPNPLAISEVNRQCCPMLYKTGDRVCYREDGTLTYLGRFDQQTKLRGYRIELGEVEAEIATYPSVAQAVVVVQGDRPENQRLVAYMTLGAQTAETTDDSDNLGQIIRARLAGVLPTYMIPAAYQVLASFPLTPNGKIDRKALPAVVASTASVQIQPTTPVETVLAEIWQSLLGIDRVSRHDNFFDVGGHSLLIVNAQSQIRQRLAVEVSLMDLFHYPTLSTLADFIQRQQQGQSEEATSAEPERAEALSAGKQRLNQRQNQRLKQRRNRESLGGAQS